MIARVDSILGPDNISAYLPSATGRPGACMDCQKRVCFACIKKERVLSRNVYRRFAKAVQKSRAVVVVDMWPLVQDRGAGHVRSEMIGSSALADEAKTGFVADERSAILRKIPSMPHLLGSFLRR